MLLTPAQIKRGQRDWSFIVIHHSWSTDNKIVSDWEAIRKYHIETLGWKDIGYHLGLEYVQNTLVLRIGRSLEETGAHCLGFNGNSIGVVLIGNYDTQIPTVEQLTTLYELCKILMQLYDISPKHIIGHRESYALLGKSQEKSCPGVLFPLNSFREKLLTNNFNS